MCIGSTIVQTTNKGRTRDGGQALSQGVIFLKVLWSPPLLFSSSLSCVQKSKGSCTSYSCKCVGLFVLGFATSKSDLVGVIHQVHILP